MAVPASHLAIGTMSGTPQLRENTSSGVVHGLCPACLPYGLAQAPPHALTDMEWAVR
jgi:hypothetical protein